jgi:hypothetical protein
VLVAPRRPHEGYNEVILRLLEPALEGSPVKRKSRRWRLEGNRVSGDFRPNVPEPERLGNMSVLNRPTMLSKVRMRLAGKPTA